MPPLRAEPSAWRVDPGCARDEDCGDNRRIHRVPRYQDSRSSFHDAFRLRGRRRNDAVPVFRRAMPTKACGPFHGFPFAKANAAMKTSIDQAWLDRVRLATVRYQRCTASFVSAEGLMLTNHHCIEACLADLSSKDKSFVEDGFLAKTHDEEKRCQTQVADVLMARKKSPPRSRLPRPARTKPPPTTPAKPRSRSSRAIAKSRQRRNARPSRCTRAANTGSTSTSATPTYAWCSRPKKASPRSAATPTISSSRAGASTWACCAPTRTASRRSRPPSSNSISPDPRPATRCSCRDSRRNGSPADAGAAQAAAQPRPAAVAAAIFGDSRPAHPVLAGEPAERTHHRGPAQRHRERHQGAPQDARRIARRFAAGAQGRGTGVAAERHCQGCQSQEEHRRSVARHRRRRWRSSAGCSSRTPTWKTARASRAGSWVSRARWCVAPRNAPSRIRSVSANTPTPRCRASSNS